ncbi:MAG: hydrolase [Defluviitaleaceae bacterium]|nr:hydrolase [Defluviitaleaceae bacterium]MCL2836183.1 hydrolase [Defluviitaleaceae bacterium]
MINQNDTLFLFIDLQERMMPAIHCQEEVIRKSCILARGARILDMPVLVTRQYPKGLGDTVPALAEALGEHDNTDKTAFSCLGDDNGFKDKLTQKNIVIAGVETHICVQQTALELIENGYNVFLAADCCGSRTEVDRGFALCRMEQAGVTVSTMESLLFEIMRSADHPARKAIQALVK